ncbi:MAG: hypothetical protein IT444_04150 [Phycisphaeraceae bacterium]|nr:hypothetical protein [Phycisphaeraceae bacterium]
MTWFEQFCRNMGLMLHNIRHPEGPRDTQTTVKKTVEEKKLDETTTLRRTVIEEVEVRKSRTTDDP